MMRRLLGTACVAACVAALGATTATADPAALGTSYAVPANITPGSGITAYVTTGGDLGELLDFLTPVLDQFVTPLSNALAALPDVAVSNLTSALPPALVADSSSAPQSAPAVDSFPSCDGAGWDADNCFAASTVGAPNGTPVALTISSAQGWAAADSTTATASARAADVALSAFGVDVGRLGTAQSNTQCPSDKDCSSGATFDDASLFGGTVAAKSAADGSLLVSVSGGDYVPLAQLSNTSVTNGDVTARVSASGSQLQLAIPFSLDQLLTSVGMSDDLQNLNAYVAGSTVTLDVFLGAGDPTGSNRAAGVRVGLGLAADIDVSVFGLVDADLHVDDSGTGNLADIRLAYTTATTPTGGDHVAVEPPALK